MKNERTTRVVVGNILLSTDTANMHKNWEELDLTVVILPSRRRKKLKKTVQYPGCKKITCKYYAFNLRIMKIFKTQKTSGY